MACRRPHIAATPWRTLRSYPRHLGTFDCRDPVHRRPRTPYPRTDLLIVEKQARNTQGYPLCFHKGGGKLESVHRARKRVPGGEVALWDKGFGVASNFFKNPVDRMSLHRYVVADLERHGSERRQTLRRAEPIEMSGAGVTGCQTFGNGSRGQRRSRGAGLVFGRAEHHRSRSRKGQANRGEGQPERGAPRSTELETAKVTRGFLASCVDAGVRGRERRLSGSMSNSTTIEPAAATNDSASS